MNVRYTTLFTFCIVLLLIVPALPPVFFPFFQPYAFAKITLFEILVELLMLLFFISVLFQKTPWNKAVLFQSALARSLIIFFLACTIATIFSVDLYKSFWGSSARGDGLFTIAHFFLLFFILSASAHWLKKQWWHMMFTVSVGASFFVALYGAAQWLGFSFVQSSDGTIFSTLGNPAYLAIYLLSNIFLALYLAHHEREKQDIKTFFYLIAVFHVFIIYLTDVRAALLGLLIGGCIALIPLFGGLTSKQKIITVIFGIFMISALLYGFSLSALFHDRTVESRIHVWKASFLQFLEYPLFGSGPNTFEHYAPQTGESFDKPHNTYLEMLVSYGTVGFAAYILIWYVMVKKIRTSFHDPRERHLWYGYGAAYAVFLFFFFDTLASLLLFFMFLAFFENKNSDHIEATPTVNAPMISGIGLLFLILFFTFHYKPLVNAYWARELFIQHSYTGMINEELKKKALHYNNTYNAHFIRNTIIVLEKKNDIR